MTELKKSFDSKIATLHSTSPVNREVSNRAKDHSVRFNHTIRTGMLALMGIGVSLGAILANQPRTILADESPTPTSAGQITKIDYCNNPGIANAATREPNIKGPGNLQDWILPICPRQTERFILTVPVATDGGQLIVEVNR